MSLPAGTRLGPYEIAASIGAGGMGEVYRASDTRLARDVAIKVMPAEFARDAQLRTRFEREARAISRLNHPNICMLFDVGQQDDIEYLVMEYLDGEPMTERLSRGPLPVADVLRYGIEIGDALDKAHRAGLIHRDLKPGNVILTRSGAKLLDFGLAKAIDAALIGSTSVQSATVIRPDEPLTAEGTLVGTFCYMAPEQLEYAQSDARSDIFAFGCMLYEMVTGRRAFNAASRAGMIAQIIASDPQPIATLRPMTPSSLDRVVRTCLAKNPDDRFQTAHDVMLSLQWIRDEQTNPSAPLPLARGRGRMWKERAVWSLALVAAIGGAVGIATWARREIALFDRPVTAAIVPPGGFRFVLTGDYAGSPVLSHDGRRVAFVAVSEEGKRTLWIRSLDSADPREIENTDDAMFPFWSPDNRSLGFFAHGKLKTVDVSGGGVPIVIADAPNARGGSWSDDNVIVYSPETRAGLYRVAANGGAPVALTTPSSGMTTNRWPLFLPGGKSFLYLAANHLEQGSRATALHLRSLDGKSDRVVTQLLSNVAYVDGRLLMLHDGSLVAQPFDVSRGVLTGTPSIVVRNVRFDASTWHGVFDAASRMLIYEPGGMLSGTHLVWFSHDGKNLGTLGEVAKYYDLKLSPDGHRLITNAGDPHTVIWVIDVDRDVRTRLTFEGSGNEAPVWSADGNEIIYASRDTPAEKAAIYRRRADGNGPRQLVARLNGDADPGASSPDGRWVVVSLWENPTTPQIWAVPLVAGEQPRALIAGQFGAHDPRISPDGRWLSYTSNESGREEIYVVPFPGSGGKWQVTTGGGRSSRWSPDGKHLDYLTSDNTLTEVDLQSGGGFAITATRPRYRLDVNPVSSSDYDLAPDGRVIANGGEADPSPLTLVANWH